MAQTASAAPPQQRIIENALNAVAGKPLCDPNALCQPCSRSQLQLLLVTPSVLPDEHAQALKDAGYAWAPSFDAEFGALPRKATMPVARAMRPGYVFLYHVAQQRWDVWQVMAYGLTRKIMHLVNREQYAQRQSAFVGAAEPKVCSRGAANLPAQLISVTGASATEQLWLAYADQLWLPSVLQRFADNPLVDVPGPDGKPAGKKNLRELRGREINPKAILAGAVPAGCLPLNAAALAHNVADFAATSTLAYRRSFALALQPLEEARIGQAAALEQAVRAIEKASGPPANPTLYLNKSLVLMLPDPLGVAEQHNTLRLATLSEHQGWMAGGPDAHKMNADPNRPWERQSLLHAAYIRAWVVGAEERRQQSRVDNGGYRSSEIISGEEYHRIQAQERATRKPYHPVGTTYSLLAGPVHRYRVTWPKTAIDQGVKDLAKAKTRATIERYDRHLDSGRIAAANKKWLAQEAEWMALIEARDGDHVAWLGSAALTTALRYDHDDHRALRKPGLARDELLSHMADAALRIEDTARCYGGGACSDASLKHLVALFQREPNDPSHWIAQTLIGQYDFWDLVNGESPDHGVRADLYTGALGVRTGYENLGQGLQLLRQGISQHTNLLLQASQQAMDRMQALALDAKQAGKYGLSASVKELAARQAFWVKATALHNYLEKGEKLFYINVRWDAAAFINATHDALRGSAGFEMKFNQHGPRSQQSQKSASATARAELQRMLRDAAHPTELTVPLLMDQAAIEAAARRGHKVGPGMLQVVGGNLLGLPQTPLALPEAFVAKLLAEQATGRAETFKQWTELGARNARGALPRAIGSGFIFILQLQAFRFAMGEFDKSGGWAQVDALASALSAAVGMVGAGLEVGAMLLAPSSITVAGTPTAGVLVAQLPKAYLRLGLGAGLMGASGAALDFVVAFAKMRGRQARGDEDAASVYQLSAGFHAGGALALFAGSWTAYRSARLTQAGIQGTVQILSVRFASSFAAAGIGMSVTGIGMLLWVAGVGAGIVAAMLEDDENETFLERSHFGRGRSKDLGKFRTLDEEMKSLATLARGFRAELEWRDNLSAADVITVRLQTVEWDQGRRSMTFMLEGYDKVDGARIGLLLNGEFQSPKQDGDIFTAEQEVEVSPAGAKAVKLTFTLWNTDNKLIGIPLQANRGAVKMAQDFIWAED